MVISQPWPEPQQRLTRSPPTDLRTRVPVVHDGALLDDLVAEGEGEVGVVFVREVRCGRRDVDR